VESKPARGRGQGRPALHRRRQARRRRVHV